MSVREATAWSMTLATVLVAGFYGHAVWSEWADTGAAPNPDFGLIIWLTIIYVVLAAAGSIIGSILSRNEGELEQDERDVLIMYKAGAFGGSALGFAATGAMYFYYATRDANVMFHYVAGALLLGALINYGLQVFFYRRGM